MLLHPNNRFEQAWQVGFRVRAACTRGARRRPSLDRRALAAIPGARCGWRAGIIPAALGPAASSIILVVRRRLVRRRARPLSARLQHRVRSRGRDARTAVACRPFVRNRRGRLHDIFVFGISGGLVVATNESSQAEIVRSFLVLAGPYISNQKTNRRRVLRYVGLQTPLSRPTFAAGCFVFRRPVV